MESVGVHSQASVPRPVGRTRPCDRYRQCDRSVGILLAWVRREGRKKADVYSTPANIHSVYEAVKRAVRFFSQPAGATWASTRCDGGTESASARRASVATLGVRLPASRTLI